MDDSQRRALRAVEDELRLHDRAMGASSCGITIADVRLPDIPLIYINDAFVRITGYDRGETLGRNCRFLQGEDRAQPELEVLRTALREKRDCTVTIRNYRRDGSLFWNELFIAPVFDEIGRLTHFVGIQTDVTARKRAEIALVEKQTDLERTLGELRETQAMLIHSEKMNALGQMVAGIAHEINNPLSFINSNLHSLRASLKGLFEAYNRLEALILQDADALRAQQARIIRRESDLDFLMSDVDDLLDASMQGLGRVKAIVQALRTFSRLDEAELKDADLRENIESALAIAQPSLRGRVQVVLDVNLPAIRCYPAELNQVFLNLIMNAAQAIPEKGRLSIRGRDVGDYIELEFEDTGTGMPPDVLDKIFDPFFTTKPVGEGTGLGLAIAYKIITERHQGGIRAESTYGSGSKFIITLPKDLRP